jgi:gamma-glutamylcyclotransferase (GGCT)/AIG2-like uncharacterized protein YtfP
MMENDLLFVYGTLRRRRSASPMFNYLSSCSELVGDATYQGQLYIVGDFPGVGIYPGAIPSNDSNDTVVGELYRLHDVDPLGHDVLSNLDIYEGYGLDFPQPNEYVRQLVTVSHDGQTIHAWMYVYNWPIDGHIRVTSGDFLNPGEK